MIKQVIRGIVRHFGFEILRVPQGEIFPVDFSDDDIDIIKTVRPYTMTSPERILALIQSVKYIAKNNIRGDIVECGVAAGGSMMAAALTLRKIGTEARSLYLFDTFAGMTRPTQEDISISGIPATETFEEKRISDDSSAWCYASLDEVRENLCSTGYDEEKIHYIKGRVEDTIPQAAPSSIALLRLDTDFYESTYHELAHLFPRLELGGVLIVDDYGHWKGCKMALDEYIEKNNLKLLLNRIDYTGRIAVKLCPNDV